MAALKYKNWKRFVLLSIFNSICATYCVTELFYFSILKSIPFIVYSICYPLMTWTIMGNLQIRIFCILAFKFL